MTPLSPEDRIYRTQTALYYMYMGGMVWARYQIKFLTGQFREYE